jgi:hypothetical protein
MTRACLIRRTWRGNKPLRYPLSKPGTGR